MSTPDSALFWARSIPTLISREAALSTMGGPERLKPVYFSTHARQQMVERGASESEVIATIRGGRSEPVKRGRQGFRRSFPYNRSWSGRTYRELA